MKTKPTATIDRPLKDKSTETILNGKNESTANQNNDLFSRVEKYLQEHYDLRYNIISNDIEIKSKTESEYSVLNENNLFIELHKKQITVPMDKLGSLLHSDFVVRYHPFVDYFENIQPVDPEHDSFIDKLCTYVAAKDQERFNKHFKKMLVRCIACALNERIINKQAFVLVHGTHDSGKTSLCRWLSPPKLSDYFLENISTDKDSLIGLCQNFIVNLDELSTLQKTEINSLKSIMSKDYLKIRLPYAKKPIRLPRTCNFIGSTNNIEFLSDDSGSVRWLCFEIEKINWDYKKDFDINTIWSEAYYLYKNGFKYELTDEDKKENERSNERHYITTPELDLIGKHFLPGRKDDQDEFVTATDIQERLHVLHPTIKLNNRAIGMAMNKLNFKKDQHFIKELNYQRKGYFVKEIFTNPIT